MVDVVRARVLDALGERVDDRLLDRLEAVLEEERGERRLEQRGEHVAVPREPLQLLVRRTPPRALDEPPAEPELARDHRAARARDDVRADLRQPPSENSGIALVELPRDRELEDAVAEELEPLVRGRAVRRPRRVGEDVIEPRRRERLDQPRELGAARGRYWCEET